MGTLVPVPQDSTNEREHRGQLARAISALQRLVLPRSDDGATTVLSAKSPVSSYARTVRITGIAQSTTTDVFTFADVSVNTIGTKSVAGTFYVNVVDEATGANAYSGIFDYAATGNGAANFTLSEHMDPALRGVALVTNFAIVADGGAGAGKLQLVTPASGKTVTVTITFVGQVY